MSRRFSQQPMYFNTTGALLNAEQQGALRTLRDADGIAMRQLLLEVLNHHFEQELKAVSDVDSSVQQSMIQAFQMMVNAAMHEALLDPMPRTDKELARRLSLTAEIFKENTRDEPVDSVKARNFVKLATMYDEICMAVFNRICCETVPVIAPSSRQR